MNFKISDAMDTTITTTEELEKRISSIINSYREEAYAFIEEKMWAALAESAICILENDSLYLLTRRAINGISTTTLNNACKIIQAEANFCDIDEHLKKCYILEFLKARSLSFEATRMKYPNYLKPWSEEDDRELEKLWCEGVSGKELALRFGRNPGAIDKRIEKLELIDKYGERPIPTA
jgi:hypothetical protein